MGTLRKLREDVAASEDAFDAACVAAGFGNRWEAYRAEQAGEPWPLALAAAHDAYTGRLHAFYVARDGERGFLGGRGL